MVVHAVGFLSAQLSWPSGDDNGLSNPPVASVVHLRMLAAGGEVRGSSGEPLRKSEPVVGSLQGSPEGPAQPSSTADFPVTPVRGEARPVAGVSLPVEEPAVRDDAPAAIAVDAGSIVDGYVLRKALTTAPVPVGEVRLTWPAGSSALGRQQAVFSLFIDENGAVRRMVADGPTLEPPVEEAARAVFMAARFQPGKVDGRAVKALIRIEVVFDNATPVAEAAPGPTVPRIVSRQNL